MANKVLVCAVEDCRSLIASLCLFFSSERLRVLHLPVVCWRCMLRKALAWQPLHVDVILWFMDNGAPLDGAFRLTSSRLDFGVAAVVRRSCCSAQ